MGRSSGILADARRLAYRIGQLEPETHRGFMALMVQLMFWQLVAMD
jgi:hypothetical protein